MAAEHTFSSPGFFDTETVSSQAVPAVAGIPAGVIGATATGPAFVPVTVGSFADFAKIFGDLDSDYMAPYAVTEFLRNRSALTFVRVLGAGKNSTTSDIQATEYYGTTRGAGFIITGSIADSSDLRGKGCVQFISAKHVVTADSSVGYPEFQDNDSYSLPTDFARIVRGMILTATGTRIQVMDHNQFYSPANTFDDVATIGSSTGVPTYLNFKLIISSSSPSFASSESQTCIRILTASLDPSSDNYIANILNTDPDKFETEEHLLYAHFPVENEIAAVSTDANSVAILSGSVNTNDRSGTTFNSLFGRFDSRYTTPRTTWFISQPFSNQEYDLFKFETLSDGSSPNSNLKVSIIDIRKSEDATNSFGTFSVLIRDFNDTDLDSRVLEQFGPCDLNPASPNYIAKVIGDYKVYYNFDATSTSDRRLVSSGKYPNRSSYVRVVVSNDVERALIPQTSLPFGFRGLPVIKTNDTLTDGTTSGISGLGAPNANRLGVGISSTTLAYHTGSIVPPLPFRFKVTKNPVNAAGGFTGMPGPYELTDPRLYWGVKFERVPTADFVSNPVLSSNGSSAPNEVVKNLTKFLGIYNMDTLVTGSGADAFNNNKFTLARVALPTSLIVGGTIDSTVNTYLTGSPGDIIRETAYIRNGVPDSKNYTIPDVGSINRLTLASLASLTSSVYFNNFSTYNKFTNVFYGGFDGTNILDKDMRLLNDRATSSESGGKATANLNIGLSSNFAPGSGNNNGYVQSYQVAASILLDSQNSLVNIVAIPGIKDPFVTNYVAGATRDYSKAIYLMDIPSYSDTGNRLFAYGSIRPDVAQTGAAFARRAIDNSYAATYFPDVSLIDARTGSPVQVAASVAALSALGFNDSVSFPWFAPAGFNRGALANVTNVATRLNSADRDYLYNNRINPIASFPNAGFVIFGQKTLQQAKTALDRVNVRRLLLEVKRIVSQAAISFIFEQNTASTRAAFVSRITPQLALIQSQQGVDQFKVVCDATNNTQDDINQNRMNGKIIVAPTRAVEFIAINFIVDSTGVTFT